MFLDNVLEYIKFQSITNHLKNRSPIMNWFSFSQVSQKCISDDMLYKLFISIMLENVLHCFILCPNCKQLEQTCNCFIASFLSTKSTTDSFLRYQRTIITLMGNVSHSNVVTSFSCDVLFELFTILFSRDHPIYFHAQYVTYYSRKFVSMFFLIYIVSSCDKCCWF